MRYLPFVFFLVVVVVGTALSQGNRTRGIWGQSNKFQQEVF